MPTELGTWVGYAMAALAIASLAGYGSLRSRLRDLGSQLVESRNETEALRRSRTEDKVLIDTQASDLAALKRVVTNEVHWVALDEAVREQATAIGGLTDALLEHNKAAAKHWAKELTVWSEVLVILRSGRGS